MNALHGWAIAGLVLEYAIKVVAVGLVPENRRPSSSTAWLLLILFVPVAGLPLYWLFGSPYVHGRRRRIQREAVELLTRDLAGLPEVPTGTEPGPQLASIVTMNRRLTGLPCVAGVDDGLLGDTVATYAAMTEAITGAREYVHVEFYIMAWDQTTDGFFTALADAVTRGVRVRLLMDHLGSRAYPGWSQLGRRLSAVGIDWHLMMPIRLLRGQWRRPDLRNHRKLLVIDGELAFMGSHNVIDPSYDSAGNRRIGRQWRDLSIRVSGQIVASLETVFAIDWYLETGEVLRPRQVKPTASRAETAGRGAAMQLVPSGPGFDTEPNQRMFHALIGQATQGISITSPYFVPDEAILGALTSAAYRGVTVDLFVCAEADQFIVGHAQRSYYLALLEAGVRIYLYPAPTVLHAKYLTIDSAAAVIGSSNMDYRSFTLDYEITLLVVGGDLVDRLRANDEQQKAVSHRLTLQEWRDQPWHQRYLDNVCRLTSAFM